MRKSFKKLSAKFGLSEIDEQRAAGIIWNVANTTLKSYFAILIDGRNLYNTQSCKSATHLLTKTFRISTTGFMESLTGFRKKGLHTKQRLIHKLCSV